MEELLGGICNVGLGTEFMMYDWHDCGKYL